VVTVIVSNDVAEESPAADESCADAALADVSSEAIAQASASARRRGRDIDGTK
jgi:hypothetical protein